MTKENARRTAQTAIRRAFVSIIRHSSFVIHSGIRISSLEFPPSIVLFW
jgi:hypothetical protein